jgi:hypothetical protein
MVQVDVFWSYGLASGLTLAAGKQLRKEKNTWNNKYFLGVLLWISLFFAPSGIYLLWAFPYWETMFVARNHQDIPAWLVTLFAVTNVTQAILGYYVTLAMIKKGSSFGAKLQPIWSHAAMLFVLIVGWDGTGFKRFTYSGTGDDWAQGLSLPMSGFIGSPVFWTLCGMGVLLVPTYFYLIKQWKTESL